MNSLSTLSNLFIGFIAVFELTLLLLIFFRVYFYLIRKKTRLPFQKVQGAIYSKILKVLFALAMTLVLVNVLPYTYIGSAFKNIVPLALNHLMAVTALALAILEIYLSFSISKKLLVSKWKRIWLTLAVLVLLPVSVNFTYYIPTFFDYPSMEDSFIIDLPVRGKWLAGHAGGNEIVNYHMAVDAQAYAMDIVKINEEGRFYTGDGASLVDFTTFGANIISPVNGKVVLMVDSLSNQKITLAPNNRNNPAGNHVVIEFEKDRYVFLAHLDSNSIVVNEGDSVNVGDLIGKAGNSGNTSWPHLHMHIQDLPYIDNKEAQGYAYRFKNINRKRMFITKEVENAFLIRNDVFWAKN